MGQEPWSNLGPKIPPKIIIFVQRSTPWSKAHHFCYYSCHTHLQKKPSLVVILGDLMVPGIQVLWPSVESIGLTFQVVS